MKITRLITESRESVKGLIDSGIRMRWAGSVPAILFAARITPVLVRSNIPYRTGIKRSFYPQIPSRSISGISGELCAVLVMPMIAAPSSASISIVP